MATSFVGPSTKLNQVRGPSEPGALGDSGPRSYSLWYLTVPAYHYLACYLFLDTQVLYNFVLLEIRLPRIHSSKHESFPQIKFPEEEL